MGMHRRSARYVTRSLDFRFGFLWDRSCKLKASKLPPRQCVIASLAGRTTRFVVAQWSSPSIRFELARVCATRRSNTDMDVFS
eukprot:1627309-Amphidinium_carterae.1